MKPRPNGRVHFLERNTGRLLTSVVALCGVVWATTSVVAMAQSQRSEEEARADLRRELTADLRAHGHPDFPTRIELISGASLIFGGLTTLLLFIHRSDGARHDRHRQDMDHLRVTQVDLGNRFATLVGRFDAEMERFGVDMERLHRDWLLWVNLAEETRAATSELKQHMAEMRRQRGLEGDAG